MLPKPVREHVFEDTTVAFRDMEIGPGTAVSSAAEVLNHTRQKIENGATRTPFSISGGEGGIQLARFASSLPTGRYAAASVEQGSKSSTTLGKKSKMGPQGPHFQFLAERVGFEPTKGYKPLLVFKTSAFNRSATSPVKR
jgi:hypothetical protein